MWLKWSFVNLGFSLFSMQKADVPRERRASKRSRTTSTRLDENQYDVGKRLKSLTGQQTAAQIEKSNRLQKRFDAAMSFIKRCAALDNFSITRLQH